VKYIFIILISVLYIFSGYSQDTIAEDEKSLLSDSIEFGGYLSPTFDLFTANNNSALLFGGEGGICIGDYIILGGFGKKLITDININKGQFSGSTLYMSYSGGFIGTVLFPKKRVLSFITVGAGRGGIAPITEGDFVPSSSDYDRITVINPKIEVVYRLNHLIAFSAGFTYNYITDVSFNGHSSSDFSSFGALVSIKLGKINNHL
jgi:hypothetical protein